MNKMTSVFNETIQKLQKAEKFFLTESALVLNGITIQPKEIEVYYYERGVFEDESVHRNDLQKRNKNHFYVHRCGTKSSDSYKGGNYAGIDYVVSDTEDVYFSYLIRSALVNDEMAIGPHKVLEAIKKYSHLEYKDIENSVVEVLPHHVFDEVMFSSRIRLGKTVCEEYKTCKLRAVLCDNFFRDSGYPGKERLVIDFLTGKVHAHSMSKEQASQFAKDNLGYIPSAIKSL